MHIFNIKRKLIFTFFLSISLLLLLSCDKRPPRDNGYKSINRKYIDIPYANLSNSQKLDIYLPDTGNGPFPVIIAVHGGSFMIGDKEDQQITPMLEGVKHGYAVVAINYRLSGEAKFPAAINDVKAAIRWVKANAKQYKLDESKIALWGNSAGANLAALAGVTSEVKEPDDSTLGNSNKSNIVHAVIDWFGPIDFLTIDSQFNASKMGGAHHSDEESPESKYFGQKITEIPELVEKSNPENYITPDDPPFFIQHGSDDELVPVEQSISFADKLKNVLGDDKVNFEIIEGAKHGYTKYETKENMDKVFAFLDKYLK